MPYRKVSFFNTTRTTVITALLALAIATVSLLGWIFDLEILRTFNQDWTSIKVNTALGTIFSVTSLLLFASGQKKRLAFLLAFSVFLLGVVSLCQYLFHWNANIDELFFLDKMTPVGNHPGRMTKISAIGFSIFGIALFLYPFNNKYLQRISEILAILVLICSFTFFIAYLYRATRIFNAVELISVSIPAIFSGMVISVSFLFSRPDTGFLAAFHKQTSAARVGIKGLFIIVTILVLFGWLFMKGDEFGFFDKAMGMSIMIILVSIIFFFATWSATRSLNMAEEELQHSESRYRTLVEQATDYIMITDQKGFLLDVNSSLCKMFGYRKEELLGLNISEIIDSEQLKNDPIRLDVLLSGQSVLTERRMMNKVGNIIEVEANIKMLPDGRILAISRDITDRKIAKARLEASEQNLRQVLSSTADSFYVIDQNYNVILINKAAEKNLEIAWGKPVTVGTNILDLVPDEKDEPIRSSLKKVFAGKRVEYELHLSVAGLPEWVVVNFMPVNDDNGVILGAYIVSKDITERKKAEEKLQESERFLNKTQSVSKIGSYVLDFNTGEWKSSYEVDNIFGFAANDSRTVDEWISIVHPDHQKMMQEYFTQEVVGKKQRFDKEYKIVNKKTMKEYWVHGIGDLEFNSNIALNKMLGTIQDITERKKAELDLEESYKAVRKLTEHLQNIREEERTHIAREIHDELGQQLTVLKMDISWLNKKIGITADDTVKQKMKELLDMLDGTVKTIRRISSELRPSLLDDLGLIVAMEWHLKEFANRSGVKTKFLETETAEPSISLAAKTGLYRIFQESLTNVARHARARKVIISLHQNENIIILKIEDDGVGFDVKKSTMQRTLGILGMKERTLMMGGSYIINSKPGKGTIVEVSIPVNDL